MPLTSGTKLGPYEIQSPLGAGGMGEVYRARDTRLERTVAIKILPEAFSADPDRLQIYSFNLGSGQRKLWTTVSPQNKTALAGNREVLITPDGAHFAYQGFHVYSTLFVANGLQ